MYQKTRWISICASIISSLLMGACALTEPKATPTPDNRTQMAQTAEAATQTSESQAAESTAAARATGGAIATSTAQAAQDSTATAIDEGTATAIVENTATAQAHYTEIAKLATQKSLDFFASQTASAKLTQTANAELTPTVTRTNTPPPAPVHTNTAAPPETSMIVRGPGEKSPGDHGVTVKNKTGANVTIYMYGDPYDYTFYIPDGNHKIYLRPGNYSFTIFACGGQSSGSGVFNSNWYWEFKCK
jgi:hypothetical protein